PMAPCWPSPLALGGPSSPPSPPDGATQGTYPSVDGKRAAQAVIEIAAPGNEGAEPGVSWTKRPTRREAKAHG
ncbi:MAG: hypothetical protein ACRDTT_09270, partial [Pseudonocardiaceae bacterium]